MAAGQLQAGSNTGANVQGRQDGSVWRTNKHPRHMQSVFDGVMYTGANALATPVTTQAGLSATTPALTLYNPIGSLFNLVLVRLNISITAAPAAAVAFALANNASNAAAPSTTTTATITSNMVGLPAAPVGQCYRIATLAAAPTAFHYLGGTTGAAAIGGFKLDDDFDGLFVIPPGVAVSIQATSAAAILASLSWKEISTALQLA